MLHVCPYMRVPQKRQTCCSLTSSAGLSICSWFTARSNSSAERCKIVLDVMSLALTRNACSGRCDGSSLIRPLPPYLHASNYANSCDVPLSFFTWAASLPAPFQKCLVGRFLLGCLLVAPMPSPGHNITLHHLYRKFTIMRRPLLADQAIERRDTIVGLREFLET